MKEFYTLFKSEVSRYAILQVAYFIFSFFSFCEKFCMAFLICVLLSD